MAAIPGPLVLLVGLLVSGFSFFLNKKSFQLEDAYSLFLYFGLLITFYGFIKTIIWLITRKSGEEVKQEVKEEIAKKEEVGKAPQEYVFDQIQKKDYDENRYQMVIKCRNCGLAHYSYANFCMNCGLRLK